MFLIVVCTILSTVGPLLGQAPTLTGAGYGDPSVIHVAPGQITTMFVTGLKTVLSSQSVNAMSIPLPINADELPHYVRETAGSDHPNDP